ncbi:class I SAM-dependent methyltransferase [Rhodobacteraceae bacterium nBUS_24]
MKKLEYIPVEQIKCPSCKSEDFTTVGQLKTDVLTRAGLVSLLAPFHSNNLCKCRHCNLVFKRYILNDDDEIALHSKWLTVDTSRWSKFSKTTMVSYAQKIDQKFKIHNRSGGKLALDIGAGEGGYLDFMTDYKRVSMDLNPESIITNQRRGIETIQSDVASIDFVNILSCDLVTCLDIFEHLRDPDRAMQNISSITAPGGTLIISTGDINSLLPRVLGPEMWWYCALPEHKVFWGADSLSSLLTRHGFKILSIEFEVHKGHSILNFRNIKNLLKLILAPKPPYASTNDKIFIKDHLLITAEKIHDNDHR